MRSSVGACLMAGLALIASPAGAAMNVATFIAKADAQKAKGFTALFSSDIKLLKSEMAEASRQLQLEKAARDKAGLPARSCPPKGATLGSDAFMAEMHNIPVAEQRTMPLKDGILWVAKRRFPCH